MGLAREPQSSLAARVLPAPLYRALTHVFAQGKSGVMLVGGTALAGYYAGHRRSDDLDLFTKDSVSQTAVVLAVKSLRDFGAHFTAERSSAHFYHVACRLDGYDFTSQVVLDANLFNVGSSKTADDGVAVADVETLLKMKAATLVSRASEKDLYDLAWLFDQDPELELSDVVELGTAIDGGVNAESILTNLVGTELRESACDFSYTQKPRDVFAAVEKLKKGLIDSLETILEGQPAPPIAALMKRLER